MLGHWCRPPEDVLGSRNSASKELVDVLSLDEAKAVLASLTGDKWLWCRGPNMRKPDKTPEYRKRDSNEWTAKSLGEIDCSVLSGK